MFKRNLVSVSIASVLLSSSLVATANTQKDEDEDSVESWGQWAKQYATAAGGEINTGALAFASFAQGESGRNALNEPEFTTPEGGCDAGAFCGFTAFRGYSHSYTYSEGQHIHAPDGAEGFGVGTIDLSVNPELFPEPEFDGDGGEGQIILAKRKGPGRVGVTGEFTVNENTGQSLTFDDLEGAANTFRGSLGHYDSDYGDDGSSRHTYYGIGYRDTESPSVLVRGHWGANESFYDGQGFHEYSGVNGQFIGGTTTTLAQLGEFVSNLNGVTATYSGWAFGDRGARQSMMNSLTINFGTKTWDATFNNGANGSVYTQINADGKTQVLGNVGFDVKGGTVNGINFSAGSAQLSAVDASAVTGSVNGALFGDAAQSVAGMIDIVKTVESQDQVYQAVFRGSRDELKNNLEP